jgi:lysophospholipase L1-like esterase
MLRGLLSGVALTLLVAVAVFTGVRITSAQSAGSQTAPGDQVNSDSVWQDSPAGSNSSTATTTTTSTVNTGSKQTDAYIALGDSVAAGLGLPTWPDATSQDKTCGRSPESYAFEVGRQLNRPHVLYACSGASSGDLFTRQWISNSNPDIQLNQAFSQGTPAVMSITVGANDLGWRSMIQRCYSSTCGDTLQTSLVDARLALMEHNLNTAMDQIQQRSAGRPPVVVLTGYYNPISTQCATVLPDRITSQEISWVTDGVNKLNQRLQTVANRYGSFARYAAVDFSGHDLCSGNSWVQSLNDPAPIHPTSAGQQAIARSVVAAVKR